MPCSCPAILSAKKFLLGTAVEKDKETHCCFLHYILPTYCTVVVTPLQPLCYFSWDPSWLSNSVDPDSWMVDNGCAGAVSLSTVPAAEGGLTKCTAVAWSVCVPVKERTQRGHTREVSKNVHCLPLNFMFTIALKEKYSTLLYSTVQ